MATNKVTTNVIDMSGNTGGLVWSQGTKAQRPAGVAGDLRLNTTDSRLEFYNGSDWKRLSETAGTPSADFGADFLVVAGGGGSEGTTSCCVGHGGGGAGGLRTSFGSTSGGGSSNESKFSVNLSTPYTVTIGAGGNGANNGSDSLFGSITSTGGGYGGYFNGSGIPATSGGSGGGGISFGTSSLTGGSGTVNQGFAGGNGVNTSNTAAAGGGGAAAVGGNGGTGSGVAGGAGGDGVQSSINGTPTYYAGGGGGSVRSNASGGSGGPGGQGGGGNGTNQDGSGGTNGTANTGGGAGGGPGGNSTTNLIGGSGIVILRYPNTYTITVGAGLTSSTTTDGSDKITTFTAGSDTVSFS
jgi:hypothetical protein